MESVLIMQEPRRVVFEEDEPPPLEPGQLRVRTLYSGISAGTEMTIYRGSNPYAQKRWDPDLKLFLAADDDPRLYPCPLGYEEVGYVAEIAPGVEDIPLGSLVYGSWSHRT